MIKSLSFIALGLLVMGAAAQAQNLFLLPGSNSNSNNVTVVSGSSLTSLASFSAGAASFTVLAKPDGSKYYIVANQGSQTVTALDSSFSNPRSLGNFGASATAAALTPDGRRLIVVAGTLHVFDTTSDFDLFPNGLTLNPASNLIDVALSLDGTRAFALGISPSGGSILYGIDVSSNTVVGTVAIQGTATAVAVGPDGFVYVSTTNQVIEVNPTSVTVTPTGTIAIIGRPGKLVFTPDGKFALGLNQAPYAGNTIVLVDLGAHTGSTLTGPVTMDQLFVAGNNSIFAYSRSAQALYQITLVPQNVVAANLPGAVTTGITAAALSADVAGGARTTSQFLYFVAGNTLYRIDLSTNQVSGQLALSQAGTGALVVAGAANTTGAPATLLKYNDNQVLGAGAISAPLVVRVLDAQGIPVSGVSVTFAATGTGVSIANATVTTTPDGFASTTITAPVTNGLFVVSASVANGQTVNFNLGVGTGGPATGSGQLTLVAGQGQLIAENQRTGLLGNSCLLVAVKDVSGTPIPNAAVTFSITGGPGALVSVFGTSRIDQCASIAATGSALGQNGPTVTATTDSNGQAAVDYLSTTIFPFDIQQTSITATGPGTNTVTFYITTEGAQPGSGIQGAFFQVTKPAPGESVTGQAGTTQTAGYIAKVVSRLGTPVPNVALRLGNSLDANNQLITDPTLPSASCVDPTNAGVLSDATGTITCDLVFGGKVGTGQLRAEIGNSFRPTPVNLTVTAGPPAKVVKIQGDAQSGTPGQTLPLAFVVQVTDAGGNTLSGVPVTFAVTPTGAVTLTNVSSVTDANGRASALGKLGSLAGAATVSVTSGTGSATFTVTTNVSVGGIQASSGGGQSAVVSTAFGAPLVVTVTDTSGRPVSGTQVVFAVTGGTATLGSPTAITDANGQASTTVTAGAGAGPITITATVGSISTTFSLTARLSGPTNVAFVNGASFQAGIAPGAIVTITGTGIATGITGTIASNSLIGPLPTSFQGAQVLFNGIAAPIYSISNVNGQESITVQVPFELTPGTATVTINAPGGGSATINSVPVAQFSPGVFETNFGVPNGPKQAVVIRSTDGSYITANNPARRGEIDCLFATGLGQTDPATATNSAGVLNQNVVAPIDVGVNNAGIRLVSATYLPGTVGVYLVCFQIPADTATGPSQPIGLIVHDATGAGTFANGTFIPIQ